VTGRDKNRAQVVTTDLQKNGIASDLFSVSGEPEISVVSEGVEFARRHESQFVISLGGGSVIDAGKAIAIMLTNEGNVLDYLEVIGRGKTFAKASAPFIAIPTTAGTGSEVTRNAVLASPEHRTKASLRSPFMLPKVALVDPELTYEVPPQITASTGMDALTQLIEPYVCSRANPITDALCVGGIERAVRSLRRAFENSRDAAAREDMAIASLFGGFALANAGLGAVHAFAGPIGGMFPAPHGAICAALLSHVMQANVDALRQRSPASETLGRYNEVARLLTQRSEATAKDGIEWVQKLVTDLRIAVLGTYGITNSDLADIAEKSLRTSSMKANPVSLTKDELQAVLEKSL
jgi:alcohol dehydrogenase class IV